MLLSDQDDDDVRYSDDDMKDVYQDYLANWDDRNVAKWKQNEKEEKQT